MSELPVNILNEIIFALGWTILHSFWQYAVVCVALLCCLSFVKKSHNRYLLSIAALSVCVVISGFTFVSYLSSVSHSTFISFRPHGIEVLMSSQSKLLSFIHLINENLFVIALLWLLGFFWHLIAVVKDYSVCRRLAVSECYDFPEYIQNTFYGLQINLGIKRSVIYKISTLVNSPCVVGVIKPIVLFPSALVMKLPQEQLEAVLLHELAHVRRHDYIVNLIQCLTKSVLFFNPFYIYISKIIDQEREYCCDDIAVAYSGSALTFSKSIASVKELEVSSQLVLAAKSDKHPIVRRVKRLFEGHEIRSRHSMQLLCSVIVGLLGMLISVGLNALQASDLQSENEASSVKSVSAIETPVKPDTRYLESLNSKEPSSLSVQDSVVVQQSQSIDSFIEKPDIRQANTLEPKSAVPEPLKPSFTELASLDYVSQGTLKNDYEGIHAGGSPHNVGDKSPVENTIVAALSSSEQATEQLSKQAEANNKPLSPLERYLASEPTVKSDPSNFTLMENSDLKVVFLDKTLDYSKYHTVILYPMTFDRLEVRSDIKARVYNAWMDSDFEDFDHICNMFDERARKKFKRSRHFDVSNRGGEGVLAVEFRMTRLKPSGSPNNLSGKNALAMQAVIAESNTGKLVAVVEHEILFGKSFDTHGAQSVQLSQSSSGTWHIHGSTAVSYGTNDAAWGYAFKRMLNHFHNDLKKLKKRKS